MSANRLDNKLKAVRDLTPDLYVEKLFLLYGELAKAQQVNEKEANEILSQIEFMLGAAINEQLLTKIKAEISQTLDMEFVIIPDLRKHLEMAWKERELTAAKVGITLDQPTVDFDKIESELKEFVKWERLKEMPWGGYISKA